MSIYDFQMKDADGQMVDFKEYKNKVLLIVNTATGCGFTPQYEGLEALYKKYQNDGFEILDFPCNQFASQAPGSDSEIKSFCQLNYDTTFRQFSKIEVKGKNQAPIYKFLTENQGGILGSEIKWNFTKFLVDRDGNIIKRYAPSTKPEKIDADIKKIL